MPRITKPLTDTEVRQAKPKSKEYTLWDGKGLCLRVKTSGSKSWVFSYYRPTTGKRANLGFGLYPDVSLVNAREARQECLSLLARRLDPQTHRIDQRRQTKEAHGNTLKVVAVAWLGVKKAKVSEAYALDIERSLERHIFPKLGKRPVHELTAREVIAELEPISKKGSHETVKRLCQRLNEVMEFAVIKELANTNPLTGISKAFQAPRKQHLPTLQPSDLPIFLATLAGAQINTATRCLIEWQLHTMTRPAEAAGACWEELDQEKGLWHIPPNRMKTRKAHTIPISPQAQAILERMKPISGSGQFVFPGERDPKTHIHRQTANMAIKRMGYSGKLVAHGLRSLASTTLNEQGFDPDVIETALAHTDRNEVRAAYNRAQYLERRRVMMLWWSEHIENCATGEFRRQGIKAIKAV